MRTSSPLVSSTINLSPAQATLHPSILQAMCRQPIDPRGEQFRELYFSIESTLKELLGTDNEVLLLGANGTQVMEAAAVNLVHPGERVLTVSQGEFGNRFTDILAVHGAEVVKLQVPIGQQPCPDRLYECCKNICNLKAVFLVHSETSVGALLDLPEIAALIRSATPKALIVVDAMTSVAAHQIDLDRWGVDALVGSSHKAIGGPLGLGFVGLSDRAWDCCQNVSGKFINKFTGNFTKMRDFHRIGQSQHALPQTLLFGFAAALGLIRRIGPERFRQELAARADMTRDLLEDSGLQLVTPREESASSVTCAWLPPQIRASQLVKELALTCGIEIGTGRNEFRERIIRIGHLGLAISKNQQIDAINTLLSHLSQSVGQPVPVSR